MSGLARPPPWTLPQPRRRRCRRRRCAPRPETSGPTTPGCARASRPAAGHPMLCCPRRHPLCLGMSSGRTCGGFCQRPSRPPRRGVRAHIVRPQQPRVPKPAQLQVPVHVPRVPGPFAGSGRLEKAGPWPEGGLEAAGGARPRVGDVVDGDALAGLARRALHLPRPPRFPQNCNGQTVVMITCEGRTRDGGNDAMSGGWREGRTERGTGTP